jgi:hypothetical protein
MRTRPAETLPRHQLTTRARSWHWLWQKFPILGRKTFHDFTGTWEGSLVSTWIDPSIGKPLPPIPRIFGSVIEDIIAGEGVAKAKAALEAAVQNLRALADSLSEAVSRLRKPG